LPAGTAEIIAEEAYRSLQKPGPGMAFLRWGLIAEQACLRTDAAEAVLAAAWATEDAGLPSAGLRLRAATLFGKPGNDAETLRLIDILRRAGAFAQADAVSGTVIPRDETSVAILTFERARIAAKDAGRHQISAALPPPAHRPHVSHGKTPAPGFLQKLFSRRS
jgi:hypothetical protein